MNLARCSCLSSPISRGTSRSTSSSCRWPIHPRFDGDLAELDRRTGGELAALAAFGELTGKRYRPRWRVGRAAGRPAAGRSRPVAGQARSRDGRPRWAPRSSDASAVGRSTASAVWLGGLGRLASTAASGGRRRARRPRRRRGRLRARQAIYRDERRVRHRPSLDELILVAPGGDTAALGQGRRARPDHRRGRERRPPPRQPVAPTTSARSSWPTRPATIAARNGLSIDVIEPERAAAELGHGHVPGGRPGQRQPAPDDRHAVRRQAGEKDALGRHLAIVGKGVCFDSGGISIKPADRMEEMKMDKTGACDGDRGHRDGRPAGPRHAAPGDRPGSREHARAALRPAGRRRPGA